MGVLDNWDEYYGPQQDDWALGDIVIAPVATLWAHTEVPSGSYPPPMPQPDGSTSVSFHLWRGHPSFINPAIELILTPAMILLDDCVLDKEFNMRVEQLVADGMSVEEAEDIVRQDDSLDRLVSLAPILPYTQLRVNAGSVRQANTLGYFPVVGSVDMDEGYVDFIRTMPVSRKLLTGPFASLSEPARNILRTKLAQFHNYRNIATDADLDAVVGKTITGYDAIEGSKKKRLVNLELNHGESKLQLSQDPRRLDTPPGHKRGREIDK